MQVRNSEWWGIAGFRKISCIVQASYGLLESNVSDKIPPNQRQTPVFKSLHSNGDLSWQQVWQGTENLFGQIPLLRKNKGTSILKISDLCKLGLGSSLTNLVKINKKIARRDLWLHITDLKSLIGTKVIFQEKKWPILKWWAALYLQNKKLFPLKASPFTAIIEWEYLIFPGGAGSHGIGNCSWVLK